MNPLNTILSISALFSTILSISVLYCDQKKNIAISIIMGIFSIDFILAILMNSSRYDFFILKFLFLIPNLLIGLLVFIYSLNLINFKTKNYVTIPSVIIIVLISYLYINRVGKSDEIYGVIKFIISSIFVAISLFLLKYKEASSEVKANKEYITCLTKNIRFIITLFLILFCDGMFSLFCLGKIHTGNINFIVQMVQFCLIVSIGYNELFSDNACRLRECKEEMSISKDIIEEEVSEVKEVEEEEFDEDDDIADRKLLSEGTVAHIAAKIENYIAHAPAFQKNPHSKITDLSKHINKNVKTVSYVLNNHFGMSFNKYINTLRVKEAVEIIEKSDGKVKMEGLSNDVGFKSRTTFYKTFNETMGTTPSNYEKMRKIKLLKQINSTGVDA